MLVGEDGSILTGTIYDVSPSGISVESDGSMALNQAVNIVGEGFTGEGIVRYCEKFRGRFRIEIELIAPVD
jgi:hypothetical protein